MSTQALKQKSAIVETAGAGVSVKQGQAARSNRFFAGVIGALFLAGFFTYGVGFGLVTSVINAPDYLTNMAAHQGTLILGAFLMLLTTGVDIGKGVLFFPILENHGKRTALAYLMALTVQVVLMAIGSIFLLMLVPVSEYAVGAAGANVDWATAIGSILTQGNLIAYNIGQATLCVGGIFLCAILYRTGLLPRFFAAWGLVGYVLHMAGSVSEIFGVPLSLMLLIPGGLWEVVLGFWLIIKGIRAMK